jgi:hypothetical protein
VILATAQSIVDRASHELGLSTASLDPGQIEQLGTQSLALLNSLGDELMSAQDWQFLESTATLMGDGSSDSFDLPADFGRIVNQTLWNDSNRRQMFGPQTAQQWGWVRFGIVATGLMYRYRIIDNKLVVFPTPGLNEQINFFYIRKNWVRAASGMVFQDEVLAPGDTPLFDRGLMIKGLKVKLWGQKGFDTTALAKSYNDELASFMAQNGGAPEIYLSQGPGNLYIDPIRNIPDGNW